MAGWPDATRLESHLGIPGGAHDSQLVVDALAAAIAEVAEFTVIDADAVDVPADVSYATLLLAGKLYNRRNTPDGVAGDGEFGIVRTNRFDGDVNRLLTPYRKLDGLA